MKKKVFNAAHRGSKRVKRDFKGSPRIGHASSLWYRQGCSKHADGVGKPVRGF